MSIKERLKQVLDSKGLNITEAANLCSVPYRSMQNYLRGEREPNSEALISIGTHLGINIDWLLTGRGFMANSNHAEEPINTDVLTNKERCWLEVFRELPEELQKNILRDAEKEKRLFELEREVQRLKEASPAPPKQKNTG